MASIRKCRAPITDSKGIKADLGDFELELALRRGGKPVPRKFGGPNVSAVFPSPHAAAQWQCDVAKLRKAWRLF